MDARSNGRAARHRTLAFALSLCALSADAATHVDAGAPAQRFRVDATMHPQPFLQSSGGFDLNASLVPARTSLVGGGFAMNANVTASPSECASDTIFADGFEM